MNKKNLVIGAIVAAIIGVVGVWYFVFYKPTHSKRDVADEVAIQVTAKDIATEFETDEQKATTKYTNKAIEVTGELVENKKNESGFPVLTLKGTPGDIPKNINCTLKDNKPVEIKSGTTITVKGILNGNMSDVIIIEAIVVTK